jgi:hypothetical protein
MELANKHHLGRKLRRSWLVSYVYIFKLTVYNLRTKLDYFSKGHRRMEFPSGISATLRFAYKHQLGRMPRLPCSFHQCLI